MSIAAANDDLEDARRVEGVILIAIRSAVLSNQRGRISRHNLGAHLHCLEEICCISIAYNMRSVSAIMIGGQ